MRIYSELCETGKIPIDDTSVGEEVVIYASDNFCRGRIVEQDDGEASFKV
jgi:hypothetical protein